MAEVEGVDQPGPHEQGERDDALPEGEAAPPVTVSGPDVVTGTEPIAGVGRTATVECEVIGAVPG